MSKQTFTLTQSDLAAIVAQAVQSALTGETITAPAKSQPASLVAAKSHCFEARMTRRSDATRKGGAGMTKAERKALAAELRAEGKDPSNARTWNAACAKARGLK